MHSTLLACASARLVCTVRVADSWLATLLLPMDAWIVLLLPGGLVSSIPYQALYCVSLDWLTARLAKPLLLLPLPMSSRTGSVALKLDAVTQVRSLVRVALTVSSSPARHTVRFLQTRFDVAVGACHSYWLVALHCVNAAHCALSVTVQAELMYSVLELHTRHGWQSVLRTPSHAVAAKLTPVVHTLQLAHCVFCCVVQID